MRARVSRSLSAALAVAVLFPLLLVSSASAASRPWESFDYPELGKVKVPELGKDYQRYELDNGMVIYLMEDHDWPLVEGRVLIRTGSVYEPAAKVGLAEIEGEVLRTGGTETMSGDDLDDLLAGMGASIESSVDDTRGTVNFSFLRKDAKRGLELVSDILQHPAFEDAKIDLAKTSQRAAIARRNDELMSILRREIPKAIWGPDHPYARNTEYATIDAITRDDLVDFYQYFYHPENMMLAVWGDFDSKEMLAELKDQFSGWKRVDNPIPSLPKAPKEQTRRVLIANKDDVTQSWFAAGQVGMKMDDPDYYSMIVMNRILGGGFSSRLFNEVRSNLGLAYTVGSSAGVGMAHKGTFMTYCGTKNSTVDKALGAVLNQVDKIRESEVSQDELSKAKEAMLNSYVFNFVRKSQTLTRLQTYDFLGYPSDFLQQYPDKIRAVNAKDVQDVAQRRVHPEDFAIVAVGKKSEWDGDLTEFGPVEDLDISIPEPKGPEFPEATAESIEKGHSIMSAAMKALGGEKLAKLSSLHRQDKANLNVQGMSINIGLNSWTLYPNSARVEISMPMGNMVQAVSADGAWAKGPQGIQDMGEEQAAKQREGIIEDVHYLTGHFDSFQLQALPSEMVGDTKADVVLVWLSDEKWVKLYFDPSTHMPIEQADMAKHMITQTMGLQVSTFSDWKDYGGILFAQKVDVTHGGEPLMSVETQSIEVNPKIDTSIFEKPQS